MLIFYPIIPPISLIALLWVRPQDHSEDIQRSRLNSISSVVSRKLSIKKLSSILTNQKETNSNETNPEETNPKKTKSEGTNPEETNPEELRYQDIEFLVTSAHAIA